MSTMDLVFFAIMRFPLKMRDFFYILKKNGLESLLIFVLF